jgi:hypothetical protein
VSRPSCKRERKIKRQLNCEERENKGAHNVKGPQVKVGERKPETTERNTLSIVHGAFGGIVTEDLVDNDDLLAPKQEEEERKSAVKVSKFLCTTTHSVNQDLPLRRLNSVLEVWVGEAGR